MMVWRNRSRTTNQRDNSALVSWNAMALVAGWSLALTPLGAHAQLAASTSGPAEPSGGLIEIVVTARRKSELLEDVPQTVTPVTAADIQNFNMQTLSDVAQVVPGLQISAAANRSLDANSFRGVSFHPASGTQNTLGFYVNDTFVTNNLVTTSIFDIGQIELLSGPQGTLRGEPSPSGSLTITTHKPDLENFGGFATLTQETYGQTNGSAAVNLPIVKDKLALRLAGLADENAIDGVNSIHSSVEPYSHTYAGRASLRFEPIDSLEGNLVYQHSYWRQAQYQQVQGPGAVGGVLPVPGVGLVPNPYAPANYNGPAVAATDLHGVQNYPDAQWNHSDLITGQIDWHFADQRLSYNGSYWTYADNNGNGALANNANQAPGITAENNIRRVPFQFDTPSIIQHVQTQELRLASETPVAGFMDYTAGAFFKHTHNQVNVVQLASFLPGSFGSTLAPPNPSFYDPKYTLQVHIDSPVDEQEISEFANFTFHVLKDTELSVGGRHIDYKKRGFTEATLLPDGVFGAIPSFLLGLPAGVPCGAAGFGSTYAGTCDLPAIALLRGNTTALPKTQQDLNDNRWIYNASLSRKFLENLLAYVNVASSWRPPAVTVGINNAANDPTLNTLLHLKSETSTDYEVGMKWTFLENRARLNLAYFHQTFKNFIYSGLNTTYLSDNGVTTAPTQFAFNSNPNAVIDGVNLDTGFLITRQWSVNLNATYANGHLTGSKIPCNPPGGTFPATAPPPYIYLCPSNVSTSIAPNFNSALESEYHMPIPRLGNTDGFVRGLWNYYGRNPHANAYYTAPGYGIANFFLGLRSSDKAWEGALFVKNAFDAQPVLINSVGNPALDNAGLSQLPPVGQGFGSSGYYLAQVAPRREFGITFTYAFGSR